MSLEHHINYLHTVTLGNLVQLLNCVLCSEQCSFRTNNTANVTFYLHLNAFQSISYINCISNKYTMYTGDRSMYVTMHHSHAELCPYIPL